MKKFNLLIIIGLLLILSCNDSDEIITPSTQAKFTIQVKNNGIAPAEVLFINESVNAISYVWKFGTGDSLVTTTCDTVFYTYHESGTYAVSLTAESKNPNLHYSTLYTEKTIVINNKPEKRLYFTDRVENKVKYVVLDEKENPVIEEFESATLNKPYGMHMDTSNGKLYVTDYAEQVMNRFNWDGSGQEIIMNSNSANFGSPIGVTVIGEKVYWGEPGGIHRANLDGSGAEVYISISGEYPQDIAYDHLNNKIYFTNDLDPESGGIWMVDFNGNNLTEIIPDVWGGAIEVDPDNNRLYYYAGNEGMYISNLDGSNSVLFDSSNAGKWAWGMAIDKENGKIYYPNRVDNTIMKADLDGNNVEIFIPALANINPNAMTIDTYR